jgi:hypothetical protein
MPTNSNKHSANHETDGPETAAQPGAPADAHGIARQSVPNGSEGQELSRIESLTPNLLRQAR